MENNAYVSARFIDLLNILDMRTHITVYGIGKCGKQVTIFGAAPVYEIMAKVQNDRVLRNYEVAAITADLVTNILIKKGE